MFNHSHTILLITRQVLARIDLRGSRRMSVKQVWTAPGCDYDTIIPEVSRAFKLGARRSGRVTIVSPDFWTDVLSIPADVAAIASVNEINQALALEAEVESGLSAFDSRTSVLRVIDDESNSDDCQWCISQVTTHQIHELSRALQNLGTKLHSIAHPIAAELTSSERISIDVVHERLNKWRELTTLGTEDVQTIAESWAACLSQTSTHSLLMLAESETTPSAQPHALAASLALLAVGGCGLWHWQTQQSLKLTTQSIEQFEKQQSQREATEAALKVAEASVVQLRQEMAKAQTKRQYAERQLQLADTMHSLQNRRWLALVDALAESANESCWVQKLESNSGQTVVHGLALDNAAANGFAGRLELALNGSGWRTAPAATTLSPHNLIAFKIVLKSNVTPNEPQRDSSISLKNRCNPSPNEIAGRIEP